MRSRTISKRLLVAATLAAIAGCGERAEPTSAPSGMAPARPSPPDVPGPFSIHEWGLLGTVAGSSTGTAASGVSPRVAFIGIGNLGTLGGKPVLYVHLDEGTREATLDVSLGLPPTSVVERFPATSDAANPSWKGVHATRGACAAPTAAPTADSEACRNVADGFCEAAELPRYEADRDVCLEVGGAHVHSLFYRAGTLDTSSFPLLLDVGDERRLRRSAGARLEGPVLYLEKDETGAPRIHALSSDVASGPLPTGTADTISVADARTRLVAEARRRGLTDAEADAFIDAWSPAFFDTCRRTGPEASGTPPVALASADRSLLYFAPEATVDAMIPLETRPRARARHRVFLVRIVEEPPMGHGGGGTFSTESGPPDATRSIVRLGQAELRGALSPDVVRRVVHRHISEVRYCHEQGLRQRPKLTGRVVIEAVIGTNGSVTASTVQSTTVDDADVGRCIATAVRRWFFPAPESGVVVWTQPFVLTNEEE